MNERGWGWTPSEIRQIQLVEWLVPQWSEQYVPVKPFYDALADQGANTSPVAYADLKLLEERSLIDWAAGIGGIEVIDVMPKAEARGLAEQLHAARANKRLRKAACRDAMVDWLHSHDATSDADMLNRETMLADQPWGMWFAEPFSDDDLDAASAWLDRQGLVKGIMTGEDQGPIHLYLTDAGVRCAEDYDSDADRYLEARAARTGTGPTFNIGSNSGPFQVAGDHAHQVQNIGVSAEHLRELITSVADLVRHVAPGASEIDAEQQTALAAAGDGAVDQSALRRFADWVLSVVRTGATAALVPAVSAATNEMLQEAGRLTGHL